MVDKIIEEETLQCVTNNTTNDTFWVDLKTILKETNLPLNDIEKLISESEFFVQNNKGQLTTRLLYRENETFINKLLNSFKNKID